jgi:crossover junction endodeoxyribonuclease RuvC
MANKQPITVLGIDVGTAIVGWGLVQQVPGINKLQCLGYGVITTPANTLAGKRLVQINAELTQLVSQYHIDAVAVESLFFSNNQKTVMSVSQSRGVILMSLTAANLEYAEYTPLQVKQGVTGYGKADKKQVQQMVKAILGLAEIPKPDDAADALAIAITHLNHLRMRK